MGVVGMEGEVGEGWAWCDWWLLLSKPTGYCQLVVRVPLAPAAAACPGRLHFPLPDRVDSVLRWLKVPCDERPALVTLYFHEPDHSGHGYGPWSIEVKEAVRQVDAAVGRLLHGLEDASMPQACAPPPPLVKGHVKISPRACQGLCQGVVKGSVKALSRPCQGLVKPTAGGGGHSTSDP